VLNIILDNPKPSQQLTGWKYFISMPHHPFFLLGVFQSLLAISWWLIDIAGRYGGFYAPISWSVTPAVGHFYLLIFSTFPLFMFGFLMTTYPRWMSGLQIKKELYLAVAGILGLGVIIGYLGLFLGPNLFQMAIALNITGWLTGLYALIEVYFTAERPDTTHALITSVVLFVGLMLLVSYALGVVAGNYENIALARIGGIWWFLLPVFFSVSHRLIPFFSNAVLRDYQIVRPDWALWVVIFGSILHGTLEINELKQFTWIFDLPIALVTLWLSYSWQFKRSFKVKILAMLHIAFLWLGIALLLTGIQSLLSLLNVPINLNRGPIHALMIGYFGSMLIAMATRVSLGHSGQPLVADSKAWNIFLAIFIAGLLRVVADFPIINSYANHLYMCSAVIWIAAYLVWIFKFIPLYWKAS
jgi:uncharacterized protein involved in response to NO